MTIEPPESAEKFAALMWDQVTRITNWKLKPETLAGTVQLIKARDLALTRAAEERMREIVDWVDKYLQRRCKCECTTCHIERNKLAHIYDAIPLSTDAPNQPEDPQ